MTETRGGYELELHRRECERREREFDLAERIRSRLRARRERGELEAPTPKAIDMATEWLHFEEIASSNYWIGGVRHDYRYGAFRGIAEPPRWLFMDAVTLAPLDNERWVVACYHEEELDWPRHARVYVECERGFSGESYEGEREDSIRAALGLPRLWGAS